MINSIAKKFLRRIGLEMVGTPRPDALAVTRGSPGQGGQDSVIQALAKDPLNARLHLQYGVDASRAGSCYLAYAELKTAQYLGADRSETENLLAALKQDLPDPLGMNHNQYFRFISLANEILERARNTDFSILDVGGGDGRLASFVPQASYCLAEPTLNGISGTALPFPDHSFDFVVSCHVLEHIPLDKRTIFLDQLLSKSKRGVILLNPFQVDGTHVDERLKLVFDVTGEQWAKEHLDCTLPQIDDIRSYARENGLQLFIKPNGTLATTMAFVFLDFFAVKSERFDDWRKVNAFFNEKYTDILDSPQYPNSYLIYLGRPEAM